MDFQSFCANISVLSREKDFFSAINVLEKIIFDLSKQDFVSIVFEIGSIPESIEHDSSEEKLYSKASDIVLARCFQEIGLQSVVLKERNNCADVLAKSPMHGYSLVADAKAFRLSRTAKNQKDFKVDAMSCWRKDNDYAVLVCPFYQYPNHKSQIYGQALSKNVALFSWELFAVLLREDIAESESRDLSWLWRLSSEIAAHTMVSEENYCFLKSQNDMIRDYLIIDRERFLSYFQKFRTVLIRRGDQEMLFWDNKIEEIKKYSREKAIDELISALKMNEKKAAISKFIEKLRMISC